MALQASEGVAGRLFAPAASRFVEGRLTRTKDGFSFGSGGTAWHAPTADLVSVSARVGRTARRLRFADGSLFETDDNDGIDRMLPRHKGSARWLPAAERMHWRLIAVVLVTVLALVGLLRYGVPAAATLAAKATPQSVTQLIDRTIMQALDLAVAEPSALEEGRQDRVGQAFRGMVVEAGLEPEDYRLTFRAMPAVGANALALPGGTIVLTDDLARLLTLDEVLAVAAHEIGHVEHHHGLRQVYRAFGYTTMVSFISGDFGELAGTIADSAALLSILAHSRAFEREADAEAVAILKLAGRNPRSLASALRRISEDADMDGTDEASFLSTHPGVEERAAAIEAAATR